MFAEELKMIQKLGWRRVLLQMLSLAQVLSPMLMVYHAMGLLTNTASPIVVVLSASMEPAFARGDIIFLTNPADQLYHTGDIIVYKIPGAEIPIVHRVLETHDTHEELLTARLPDQKLLTKGDNNPVDDIGLYKGLKWLERKHVVGKVRGFLPFVGYITIAMNDIPQLKYALFGAIGFFALTQRE